jgi:hypothetical protein
LIDLLTVNMAMIFFIDLPCKTMGVGRTRGPK